MPDSSPDKPDLSTHPLVSKLVGDSDTPPSLVALAGYFGPSRKADSIRLYTDLGFQSYFEIPKASIVATTPTDATDDQSPTLVHVKAGTSVDAVQTSTQPVESYLQGISAAPSGGDDRRELGCLRTTPVDQVRLPVLPATQRVLWCFAGQPHPARSPDRGTADQPSLPWPGARSP